MERGNNKKLAASLDNFNLSSDFHSFSLAVKVVLFYDISDNDYQLQ